MTTTTAATAAAATTTTTDPLLPRLNKSSTAALDSAKWLGLGGLVSGWFLEVMV